MYGTRKIHVTFETTLPLPVGEGEGRDTQLGSGYEEAASEDDDDELQRGERVRWME